MTRSPEYQPQSAADTIQRILGGDDPWLAFGQFLDDWRRTPAAERTRLTVQPPPVAPAEYRRWAALLAAVVEWLCAQDGLPFPSWTGQSEYRLADPWFLYPGWRLRAWQLAETPASFKARNIFGGDRIMARV
jgi:hypothetical protein